jgi:hypothetical protein
MRFTPEQPLPTWAEAKPDLDAFKPKRTKFAAIKVDADGFITSVR